MFSAFLLCLFISSIWSLYSTLQNKRSFLHDEAVESLSVVIPSTPSSSLASPISNVTSNDVIARHLACINKRLDDIESVLSEVETHVLPSVTCNDNSFKLPDGIKLPCQTREDVEKVEEWLAASTDNRLNLEKYLSLVGGKKVPRIVRRILEKVFSNGLAAKYNWTGKNSKIPLRELELPKVIVGAVRRNNTAELATDAYILGVLTDWFRFSKDRDGGRAARRLTSL